MSRDRPSLHGAVLGGFLAAVAEAGHGEAPEIPEMCATCAFRPDCMTNQMAATGLIAFNIVMGVDQSSFGCHHGLKDGAPTKVCVGFLAAKLAPFDRVKALSEQLGKALDAIAGQPDLIRAKVDAWIAKVDPADELDDYQRGRLWLREFGGAPQ